MSANFRPEEERPPLDGGSLRCVALQGDVVVGHVGTSAAGRDSAFGAVARANGKGFDSADPKEKSVCGVNSDLPKADAETATVAAATVAALAKHSGHTS